MSLKHFCQCCSVQKNLKELRKLWPDDVQLKGRGHAKRTWITSQEADAFFWAGFIPKQIATHQGDGRYSWSYIAPSEAVLLMRQSLKNLGDFKL
jgi:hypothetical protein